MKKKEFVLKFIKDSNSICWPKEMKIVKSLFRIFPNVTFWATLKLNFKLNSLCWFLSDQGRDFLNKEYKQFCFEPSTPKQYFVDETSIDNSSKTCDSAPIRNTLKNFLKLW